MYRAQPARQPRVPAEVTRRRGESEHGDGSHALARRIGTMRKSRAGAVSRNKAVVVTRRRGKPEQCGSHARAPCIEQHGGGHALARCIDRREGRVPARCIGTMRKSRAGTMYRATRRWSRAGAVVTRWRGASTGVVATRRRGESEQGGSHAPALCVDRRGSHALARCIETEPRSVRICPETPR